MGQSIAVMNTKGGVGKSTVTMALAETLSSYHNKNVLVIDSDSQTSISIMMSPMARWERMEAERRTIVELLSASVLVEGEADWKAHVLDGVSDVDDAKTVYLLPSHMNLTLFEREVSAGRRHSELRQAIRNLLDDVARYFDVILVDCPPGLSVLTECWLRECDFYLPPTKADYLSVRGLDILKRFRDFSAQHGFADLIGVLVNQKDEESASEAEWHEKLLADPANRCFLTAIPRRPFIQRAADFHDHSRSFLAKYPGDAGAAIRALAAETLDRMSAITILRSRMVGDDVGLDAEVDRLIAEAMRDTLERRRNAQAGAAQGQRAPTGAQRPPSPTAAPPPPAKAAQREVPAVQPARPEGRPQSPDGTQPARTSDVPQAAAAPDPRPAPTIRPKAPSWDQRGDESHQAPMHGRARAEREGGTDPAARPWPVADRQHDAPHRSTPSDPSAAHQVANAPSESGDDGEEVIALQPLRPAASDRRVEVVEARPQDSAARLAASAANASGIARADEPERVDEGGDDAGILDLGGLAMERRNGTPPVNGQARAGAPLDAFASVLRRPFGPQRPAE